MSNVFTQGDAAIVTIHPTAIEGGFLSTAEAFRQVTLLAACGQTILASPKGLAHLWGIEPRVVAKALSNLRPTVTVHGSGYIRNLEISPKIVGSSRLSGTTPDLSYGVSMGYKLPDGPVSLWRGRGLSQKIRNDVFDRDGRVCAYCKTTSGKFHIDHIKPVASGGGDEMSNLAVSCAGCNLAKSDMALEVFLSRAGLG